MSSNQDLAAMFNAAQSAAETDADVLSGKKSEPEKVEEVRPTVADEVAEPERNSQPEAVEPQYDEGTNDNEQSFAEEESDDQPQNTVNSGTPEFIAQIINISDLYRAFDDNTQELSNKFFETDDESEIIAKALIQEIITLDAMKSFENVHKATDVDKAFFLVSLPDDLLQEIGRLVKLFTGTNIKFTEHIKYCRDLESEMSKLDDNFITEVMAIREMLVAAQPQESKE